MNTKKITLSTGDKLAMISNFATMLTAGISILEIVESLTEDAKGNQRKMLMIMHDDLSQGNHLYISMSKFPRVFDSVAVSLVKASEEAGTLDVALRDLKENIRKDAEFTDKVKAALTYPFFILIVMVGVLGMILVVVIPKISTVFSRLRVPLPLPTKVMIFMSDVIINYTVPLALFTIGIVGTTFYMYKNHREIFMGALFRLPLVSKLILQIDITRFTRSLYYLLNSAIPITTALELSRGMVMTSSMTKVVENSLSMVSQGKRLSEGLRTGHGKVPTLVIKIVEAGEKSGTLDKSLLDIAEYMEYQVTGTLRTLTALLEPILLVFIGLVIGGMMLSIIGPIYGMIGQVGQR